LAVLDHPDIPLHTCTPRVPGRDSL
jgi:hypothetical protein